jgi:ABC-type multidrug transport system ATPase subunit
VNLTVQQNLSFFAAAYGLKGAAREGRIRWALDPNAPSEIYIGDKKLVRDWM